MGDSNIDNRIFNAIRNSQGRTSANKPKEIADTLYEFGMNFESLNNNPSIDISGSYTREELRDAMHNMYKFDDDHTEEDFEKGFEVFFSVFDQDGNGSMDTSELTLFDNNVEGDSSLSSNSIWSSLVNHKMKTFSANETFSSSTSTPGDTIEISEPSTDSVTPDDAAPDNAAVDSASSESRADKNSAQYSVDQSQLPEGAIFENGFIYSDGVKIGEVVREYVDRNGDGKNEIQFTYLLYENPNNLPPNSYATETGEVYEISEDGDKKLLVKQPVNEINEAKLNAKGIYTNPDNAEDTNLYDEKGNIVGHISPDRSNYYLYADTNARVMEDIPSSWTVNQETGEIKDEKGNTVVMAEAELFSEKVQMSVIGKNPGLKRIKNNGEISGYIIVHDDGTASFYLTQEEYDKRTNNKDEGVE